MEDEKLFLHNMASPLSVATFLIDAMVENAGAKAIDVNQLREVLESLNTVNQMMRERRKAMMAKGQNREKPL
jgi:hypothetical protein